MFKDFAIALLSITLFLVGASSYFANKEVKLLMRAYKQFITHTVEGKRLEQKLKPNTVGIFKYNDIVYVCGAMKEDT